MASGTRSAAGIVDHRVVDNRPDLTTRSQIHDLVVVFYRELIMDERWPRSTGARTSRY